MRRAGEAIGALAAPSMLNGIDIEQIGKKRSSPKYGRDGDQTELKV